ncbi:MAG: ABC transporter substrate-binding protein, partial [Eubacterium sp.]
MKKRVISLAMVVMLCLSVFALSGCGGGSSSSEDVIKIGTLGPYTGDTASYGNAAKNGIELAVDQINEAGGVLGKKIELVSYDTKGDATEAVNAYNRLRDNDGVVAIVGPVLSGEALAIKDLAKEDNMPILSPTATADDVTVGADNSFRVCYLDAYQGNAGANYAVDVLGAKNAAILVCKGNAYSEGLA